MVGFVTETWVDGIPVPSSRPQMDVRAAPEPDPVAASAGDLRQVLCLTPHQLGELTGRLQLDIGDRPNYPRYRQREVHLLVAALALRELRVPLEDACAAVVAYADHIQVGLGWLVVYPVADRWIAIAARVPEAVTSMLLLTGRASVLDLATIAHRCDTAWAQLLRSPSIAPD